MPLPLQPPGRVLQLDILRGAAILLVLARHVPGQTVEGPLAPFIEVARRGGWVGVDLFFVLSGFLVSGLLFREHQRHGRIRIGRFLLRRGLKIYPAFYIMLFTVWLVSALTGRTAPAKIWLCEALFVQNYGPSLLPHSWSLAVEAHFYLLLAVLFAVLVWSAAPGRPPFRCVPSLAAVLAGMVLTARCLHAASGPFTFKESVFPTHLRIDTLFVGVMLSYFHTYHHGPLAWVVRRFRIPLAAAALAMAFPAFVLELGAGPFLPTAGLTALSFAAGSVLLLALFPAAPETWGRSLPARVVSTIGMHSYSVYLWHFPIRLWGLAGIETLTERSLTPPESLVLYVVLSVGGGMALGRLIETPFLALRDRLSAARTMKRHAARAESCPLPDSGAPALPLARMES